MVINSEICSKLAPVVFKTAQNESGWADAEMRYCQRCVDVDDDLFEFMYIQATKDSRIQAILAAVDWWS